MPNFAAEATTNPYNSGKYPSTLAVVGFAPEVRRPKQQMLIEFNSPLKHKLFVVRFRFIL